MNQSKTKVKLAIYSIGLLMMGVIGVTGALVAIGENFPTASQTMVQNIISIPCLVVIPATVIIGKLMDTVSAKTLAVFGILAFLVGGVVPYFLNDLTGILFFRGVLGIGIGTMQTIGSALVAQNFEGAERDREQGKLTSAQMLGCCVMVFAGGWLGAVKWNLSFLTHLLAVVSLILVLAFLPSIKPQKTRPAADAPAGKAKLTGSSWSWALVMFILFISAQIYSVYMAYIVSEKALGTSAQAGNAMAFMAIGGFLMGLYFGKLAGKARGYTFTVGLLCIVVSYFVIAYAASMGMIYVGALFFGAALSICMPVCVVGTGNSVAPNAAPLAISITMCAQNAAQFVCPYICNPIVSAIDPARATQWAFILGGLLAAVMALGATVWGAKQNKVAI
jgi:MFS family permease